MVYRLRLPAGGTINLFFYDGPISRAVAFEGLLDNGEQFAQRLLGAFSEETRPWPELVHIATDGETYGHHHLHGEMALTYALNHIESNDLAELTNYGLYLERHPATHLVEIFENSSWSCVHGVERWRSNCGCNSGGHGDWNQEWRAPLREALDWLRDTLAPLFEEKAGTFLKDPWAARNDYIDVLLDRSAESRDRFLSQHAVRPLGEAERVTVWKLMELQRHAMLMYTSCGWFFDELSGIETVQVIQYAGRAAQLAEEVFGFQGESLFMERLGKAKSNIPEHQDGARIYQKFVKPAFVDLRKVGGHYAIRSLFEPYETNTQVYDYAVERQAGSTLTKDGKRERKLAVGKARFISEVTQEALALAFAGLDRGDFNAVGGILKVGGDEGYAALAHTLTEAFSAENLDEVSRILEENFEGETYSLTVLFRDEQRRILNRIMESEWAQAEAAFDSLYPHLMSITHTLAKLGSSLTLPRAFRAAAEFALNTQLRRTFASEALDCEGIRNLISDAEAAKVALDLPTLEYTLRMKLERMAERFRADTANLEALAELETAVGVAHSLPLAVNLWKIQNTCYELLQTAYPEFKQKAEEGDETAKTWINHFQSLAEKISLRVE